MKSNRKTLYIQNATLVNRESIDGMLVKLSRICQALITGAVAFGIVFLEAMTYGPDIDGRSP